MKKIALFVWLLLPLIASTQQTILWKVSSKSDPHISYLLGTEHLLDKSYVDSFPIIRNSLKQCDIVITEVNKDSNRTIAYYNTRPSSYKLNEVVSAKELAIISFALSYSAAKDWSKFTPGELFAKVSNYTEGYEMGILPGNVRIDDFIQILARENNKQSVYFESDSFQLEVLQKATSVIDWNYFKKNIGKWLEKYNHPPGDFKSTKLYKQFYEFNLVYAFNENCSGDILLEKRNDEWMKQLLIRFRENNCFVAVGLSHLDKKCGLIQQLTKAGYNVEPVNMK